LPHICGKQDLSLRSTGGGSNHFFFSGRISNAQRLPKGDTLINDGVCGRFFEVTTAPLMKVKPRPRLSLEANSGAPGFTTKVITELAVAYWFSR
jgi:hypothetical protein